STSCFSKSTSSAGLVPPCSRYRCLGGWTAFDPGAPMKARSTLLIGCGPANLALLTCLAEEQSHVLADLQLFERRENAAWHPGLELEGSVLQVLQFHDLALFRNPASPYTIFSFLRERGLLHQYVYSNYLYPSRKLFSEYLA